MTKDKSKNGGNGRRKNRKDLYHKTMERNPMFVKHLIDDILTFDDYTEYEIAFGSGVSLENVRKLMHGKIDHVDRKMFQELIHFYSRTVCGWCLYRYKDHDFEYYPD